MEAAGAALVEAAAEEVSEALVEAAVGASPEAQAEKVQVIKRDRSRPAAKIFLFIRVLL